MIVAQARTATIDPLSDVPHNETCTVQQSNSTYNFPQFFEGFEMERVLIVTEHNSFWETGQMNSVVRRRSFPFHSATASPPPPRCSPFSLNSGHVTMPLESKYFYQSSVAILSVISGLFEQMRAIPPLSLATRFWSSCFWRCRPPHLVIFPCFKIDPFIQFEAGRDADCRGRVSSEHKIHTISMVEMAERRSKRKWEKQMRSLLRQN